MPGRRRDLGETSQGIRERQIVPEAAPRADRLTHYLFRYPAKFHPPIAKALLEEYTRPKHRVFDPFCGSGTLLVESAVLGREAVGSDVDPLAVFISRVKTRPLPGPGLQRSFELLEAKLHRLDRGQAAYETLQWEDISEEQFKAESARLRIPAIPNLPHWFRRHVSIDLARIKRVIVDTTIPESHRPFFLLCFAAIIRSASNADPVPVSGLEVTAYMKKRDADGRVVDPFALFRKACRRGIQDMIAFKEKTPGTPRVSVMCVDATRVAARLKSPVDAIITSPPYHSAVDYYRRHQLEMFWLDLTRSQEERLVLLQKYIGRPKVAARHPFVSAATSNGQPWRDIEAAMRGVDPERANALHHYCVAMEKVFVQLARITKPRAVAIFVVGHSAWNGAPLDTSELFSVLAKPSFELVDHWSYPVTNRYMSYARRNGANIDREFVLVLQRTRTSAA